MRGKIWFPQGGCTIDGRKFDPRVVETKLDLGGKGFVSYPVNQTGVFRPRNRVCATILYMHEIFQYFISFIGSVGAKIVFVTRKRGPRRFNIDPSDRVNGIIENFLGKEREFCGTNAWMYIYLNIIRKRRKARDKFWFGNVLFTETNYRIPVGQFL